MVNWSELNGSLNKSNDASLKARTRVLNFWRKVELILITKGFKHKLLRCNPNSKGEESNPTEQLHSFVIALGQNGLHLKEPEKSFFNIINVNV